MNFNQPTPALRTNRSHYIASVLLCGLVLGLMCAPVARGQDEPVSNEYRFTLSPYHEIKGNLSGSGQFEYRDNPEADYRAYQAIWPGLAYSVNQWLQLSGGWLTRYTVNEQSANTLELRPFAGVQLFVPNEIKWHLYNYTRYEFRVTENLDTHNWTSYSRVRSRFGVEVPLTSRGKAWQLRTWYGLADVEPIYRFDHDTVDPLYVRGGFGYVLSDRVRLEFVYWAQFARPNEGSLQFVENIFQMNFKIGLGKGLLAGLFDRSSG